ncbi:MAG: Rieske 2Fe-2S domain-containing protein, partial [Chloroflexi bacterium]|nr:Rieske 2Fe-2S domain-containing protein [Chloroflexota bacterium]
MARFQVAPVTAIAANTMRGFQVADRRVLIVNCDGHYYALDELCPHLSVPLGRGELKDGRITCAGHGSVFDVRTGEAC